MERLKNKVLIIFLIIISLVLGYQSYSMADDLCGTIFKKPAGRTGVPVKASNKNMFLFCRERHNSWSSYENEIDYICVDELDLNKEKQAYGVSYFLHKSKKIFDDEKDSAKVIQNWIWDISGQSDAKGDKKNQKVWKGFEWQKYFANYNPTDGTFSVSGSNNNSSDNIILSDEEKKYVKELTKLFNYLESNLNQINDNKISIQSRATKFVNTNLYNWAQTKCDKIIFVGRTGEKNEKDVLTMYTMMAIETTEKSNISAPEDGENQSIIEEMGYEGFLISEGSNFYSKGGKHNNFKNLRKYMLKIYKQNPEVYNHNLIEIINRIDLSEMSVNYNSNGKEIKMDDYTYIANGLSMEEAAACYQWLMTNGGGFINTYAKRFDFNATNAKIAVDAKNKSYIMGPFTIKYPTVILNEEKLLGLNTKDGKTGFSVKLNGNSINYSYITNSGTQSSSYQPKHNETFYIKILNEDIIRSKNKGDKEFLRETDEVKFITEFTRVKEISAKIHFLTDKKYKDTEYQKENGTYDTKLNQRLMAYDSNQITDTIEKKETLKPGYSNFQIIKVDAGKPSVRLDGAEFLALARYTCSGQDDIFLDLETQKYATTGTVTSVLNSLTKNTTLGSGKIRVYRTKNGKINFKNMPDEVRIKNKNGEILTYTLESIVAKEIKAPDGYVKLVTNIEIPKNGSVSYPESTDYPQYKPYYYTQNGVATVKNRKNASEPYSLTLRKVDEKGKAIPNLNLSYTYETFNRTTKKFETTESNQNTTTNSNGIATLNFNKQQRDTNKLIRLTIKENAKNNQYDYFKNIVLYFVSTIDSEGKATQQFPKNFLASGYDSVGILEQNVADNIINGVYKITKLDGTVLVGQEAYKYVKTGTDTGLSNIDIKLINEEIDKKYNLVLEKFSEKGTNTFLDGTKFAVTILQANQKKYRSEVEIVDGKATIENLKIYGDDIHVYLQETNTQKGFKNVLAKTSLVLRYSADKKGNLQVKWSNQTKLNPDKVTIAGYNAAKVVSGDTINLQLGIVNPTESYSLKFKKVNEDNELIDGATFILTEDVNSPSKTLGTATSKNGYVTFTGLNKISKGLNDLITLYLYETSAPLGYKNSTYDKNHALKIEYVYLPGSGQITMSRIVQNNNQIWPASGRTRIDVEDNDAEDIIFNFGRTSFTLTNTSYPIPVELFTKVDKDGNPISNVEFKVSIHDENGNFVKNSNNQEIKDFKVVSKNNGKVIVENVKNYGKFYVEVKEISAGADYKVLEDTLKFNYIVKRGDKKVTFGKTLEVLYKDGTNKIYEKQSENSTAFQDREGNIYKYITINDDGMKLINENPYQLVIQKINSMTKRSIKNVAFSAKIQKDGKTVYNCEGATTNDTGKIILNDIDVYSKSTDENPNITAIIKEDVPESYKWSEYETVTYKIVYTKYRAAGELKVSSIEITAQDTKGNTVKTLEAITNISNYVTVNQTNGTQIVATITNIPTYDLEIFDKKVFRSSTGEETQINSGLSFTGYVINPTSGAHEDVKVEFTQDGRIVAKGIDGRIIGQNLKFVLTECESNRFEKINPITVVYNCSGTISGDSIAFSTAITGFEYNGRTYAKTSNNIKDLIDGIIYVVNGKNILVNPPKRYTSLAFRKVDENGNPIYGVKFSGYVVYEGGATQNFTTDLTDKNGLTYIKNINNTGSIRIVITNEDWGLSEDTKRANGYNFDALEQLGTVNIAGLKVIRGANNVLSIDYSGVTSDNENVVFNEETKEIKVINHKLTYPIPITVLKTTKLVSDNPTAEELANIERLKDVIFDVKIKTAGKEDAIANPQIITDLRTNESGILEIHDIEKIGEHLILELKETSEANNTTILAGKVYIHYKATRVGNNVKLEIIKIEYEKADKDGNKVKILSEKAKEALGINKEAFTINIENPRDYKITLYKKSKINGETKDIENPKDKVTFKGIITTNEEIKQSIDRLIAGNKNSAYNQFKGDLEGNKYRESTDLVLINGKIDDKGTYTKYGLKFYNKPVYVYFIETDVHESMTTAQEIFYAEFTQDNIIAPINSNAHLVERDSENNLNIGITVINNAKAYEIKLIKEDAETGSVASLAGAKFSIDFIEQDSEGTKDLDKAVIEIKDDGTINLNNSSLGKYLIGAHIDSNGYLVIDNNKFSNNNSTLQLKITEERAPRGFEKLVGEMLISYKANPFESSDQIISNITVDGVHKGLVTAKSNEPQSIDITIPNPPKPYTLNLKKVIANNLATNALANETAKDIDFEIKFYNQSGSRLMRDAQSVYRIENGEFKIENLTRFDATYYITIEEKNYPKDIVKLEGIHVFEVNVKTDYSKNNTLTKSIKYVGTATIAEDSLKSINKDDVSKYNKYFDIKKDNVDITIENEKVSQYYIDITKMWNKLNTTQYKMLEGAQFSLYLNNPGDDYQKSSNKLEEVGLKTQNETDSDGTIIIGPLSYVGKYKLTIVEEKAPIGYKKIFEKVEVIYTTSNGKNISIDDIKVYLNNGNVVTKESTDFNNYVISSSSNGQYQNKTSINLTLNNEQIVPVPISLFKVYYKGDEKVQLPVAGAVFEGYVCQEGAPETERIPFTNKITDQYGKVDLGKFKVDGNFEIYIKETSAPEKYVPIEPTTIFATAKDGQIQSTFSADTNEVEGLVVNNTFTIPEDDVATITIGGFVWEDMLADNKSENTYNGTNKKGDKTIQLREGLYDEGETRVSGMTVFLHECNYTTKTEEKSYTTITDSNGNYTFTDLNPFKKYYVTFAYNGTDYESVKFLVQDEKGTEFTDKILNHLDMLDKVYWKVNSKAITNKSNKNIATTTENNKAIGDGGSTQYYPIYDKFTLTSSKGVTLYVKDGKYYTVAQSGGTTAEFKPLDPSHQYINFGLKEKPTFDLRLEKDVEYIKIGLDNGLGMTYQYGTKPDSQMYILPIKKANINRLKSMEIIYKIKVTNEERESGTLEKISDYYNSNILTFSSWCIGNGASRTDVISNNRASKDIIPIQTYESGSLNKSQIAQTGKVELSIGQELATNDTVTIYVKYTYNNSIINKLKTMDEGEEYATLGLAEITSSTSKNGRGDKDSICNNLVGKFKGLDNFYVSTEPNEYYVDINPNIKEDDEDAAPAAKIIIDPPGRESEISGTVFEDLGNTNGELDENDVLIKGIKVELYEVIGTQNKLVAETTTNDKGEYKFADMPAGYYVVKFTYGDKNTVLPIYKHEKDNGDQVIESEPVDIENSGKKDYLRQNNKSYNALEFEGTTYTAKKSSYYWYAWDKEENGKKIRVRYSDAQDEQESRNTANAFLNSNSAKDANGKTYGIMDNKQAERLYSYNTDINNNTVKNYIKDLAEHCVTAKTPVFKLNIENTDTNSLQYSYTTETGKTYYGDIEANTSVANYIDFGIKARPQSNIKVEKEVDNVKIYTSAGNVNVDVKYENGKPVGTATKVQWNKGDDTLGYIWIQRSEEEIVGAILEITYKITVTDESGELEVVRIADYVQNGMTYAKKDNVTDTNNDKEWTVATKSETNKYDINGTKINDKINLTNVNTILVKDLTLSSKAGTVSKSATAKVTLTKTLNNYSETDIDSYTNYVEVIQTANEGLARKDIDSIPGNYDPIKNKTIPGNLGKIVTTVSEVTNLEKDSAKSREEIMITRETGEDRSTNYIILACGVIALFVTGVVMIKKFAIKQ